MSLLLGVEQLFSLLRSDFHKGIDRVFWRLSRAEMSSWRFKGKVGSLLTESRFLLFTSLVYGTD